MNTNTPTNTSLARVIAEHRERYIVRYQNEELEAEITGNMRFTAQSREDFPAVGDWVTLTLFDDNYAIIQSIAPRTSLIKRQSVSSSSEVQVIAANIDVALILQALDRDFNPNRLERYLTLCYASKVEPVVILSKSDLTADTQRSEIIDALKQRLPQVPILALSNENGQGFDDIQAMLEAGKTYCLLGSSGVGKSTLLNRLLGTSRLKTGHISESVQRGRHVTTHRELFILDNGAMIIDNPGMREVGMADAGDGLNEAFDQILELASGCRYADCTHNREAGCAVRAAVEEQRLDAKSYENYLKLQREQAHYDSSVAERRQRDKTFGKMMKDYKKKTR